MKDLTLINHKKCAVFIAGNLYYVCIVYWQTNRAITLRFKETI